MEFKDAEGKASSSDPSPRTWAQPDSKVREPVDLAALAKDLEKSKAHYETVKTAFQKGEQ